MSFATAHEKAFFRGEEALSSSAPLAVPLAEAINFCYYTVAEAIRQDKHDFVGLLSAKVFGLSR